MAYKFFEWSVWILGLATIAFFLAFVSPALFILVILACICLIWFNEFTKDDDNLKYS